MRGVKFGLCDEKQRLMDTGYTDREDILIFDRLDDGIYHKRLCLATFRTRKSTRLAKKAEIQKW